MSNGSLTWMSSHFSTNLVVDDWYDVGGEMMCSDDKNDGLTHCAVPSSSSEEEASWIWKEMIYKGIRVRQRTAASFFGCAKMEDMMRV